MLLQKTAPGAKVRQATRLALVVSAVLGVGAVQALNASSPDAAKPRTELSDRTPLPPRVKLIEACPQMPKPEAPPESKDWKGNYKMEVKFRIGSDGHPDWIQISGSERTLAPMLEKTVRAYGCKPELAGTELKQDFEFMFD